MRSVLFIVLLIIASEITIAQDSSGYIYGIVSTIDDKKYEGAIRWDDEEVFWSDYFNSVKSSNKYHQYIEDEDMVTSIQKWFSWDDKKDHEMGDEKNVTIVQKSIKEIAHVWVCHFGDIRSMQIEGDEKVILTLKNGDNVIVKGGSNDINTSIRILSEDFGELTINWDRIKKVDFKNTPVRLSKTFGDPLFGTVKTSHGSFTGFIQWDHDERLTTDKLDGETVDGKASLEIKNIKSITKKDDFSSEIELRSGRKISLHGSNDVNEENRGIIIDQKGLGRIDVKWDDFISVEFIDKVSEKLYAYSDFKNPEMIKGSVRTKDGEKYSGRLAYDLDEEYDFELIQGKNKGMEYSIPLKNIAKLAPYEGDKTKVSLLNGQQIILGGTHDVSEYNSGVLVFSSDNEPTILKWSNVSEIILNH